ncbi:reductive dehalogenase [Dehalococcoides mccartyi]|uniref:reductive dehalogenase n=1 Tax=Dehalococcoides mccartyi TaxID=61435 RepID=UPI0003C8AAEC|nr:reductive dehalogenase [Dehalococcoides mccartyi]AHB14174.1 reductive dehalogenase [Dehalococcoides mccartyi GY50]
MIKKHSTVSRRDFMKGLGLAGAGIGAAAAVTPVFHDLDELLASPQAKLNRPWYVKSREFGDIGMELDWNLLKRRDQSKFTYWKGAAIAMSYPGGPAAFHDALGVGAKAVQDKTKELWPDYQASTRDVALGSALGAAGVNSHYADNIEMGGYPMAKVATPDELGIPKWQGTPEENLLMLRAVLSVAGLGPSVGVAELNSQTQNFIWDISSTHDPFADGTAPQAFESERIIFDDSISEYYRTRNPNTIHIPTSHKYVITAHNMSCDELLRRPFAGFGGAAEGISYTRVAFAKNVVQNFMRGLGYHVAYGHKLQPAPVWDFLSGLAEHCRMGQIALSPEYGALMRTHAIFYTDLPLAFTPPVDAGITKFCETCGICADTCPMGAVPKVEIGQNWETFTGQDWAGDDGTGGIAGMYNIPGYKGWRCDLISCTVGTFSGCGAACKSNCPFNTIPDGSFMHSIVKSTVSTTPLFNSFFRNMEETMRYGLLDKEPSSWWNNPAEWHVYGTHPALLEQ